MSRSRRLLVVSYHFGVDGPVGGLRWVGLTKHLARLSWTCAVVTNRVPQETDTMSVPVEPCPRWPTLLDGARWLRRQTRGSPHHEPFAGPAGAARDGAPPRLLDRLGREIVAGLGFPDESRGWILGTAWRTRALIRRVRPHVVVSSGPPHSAHLAALLATAGTPVRWFVDLRDPWAGPLPEIWRSHRRLGTRLYRTLSPRVERLAFRAADGVITNTPQLARALAARYAGVAFACIPNGVDPETLPPPAQTPYPGLSIVHAGTLYAGRDIAPVLRALRALFERAPDAARAGSKLRIAGDAEPSHARVFYRALQATGMARYVERLGRLPRAAALDAVQRSQLALVLAQQQELQIPAKLYESIAMGIPTLVVAPPDSATGIEGRRLGAFVHDAEDIEGMTRVLEQLWRNGSQCRPACHADITYDRIAPLVDRLFTAALRD